MRTGEHSAELSRAIAKGRELSGWLTRSITGLTFTYQYRSGFAVGCLDIALEHHDAIVLLVEVMCGIGLLAPLRLTFESYIRAIWLLDCADEADIERFRKDKLERSVHDMVADLEKLEGYSGGTLSTSWKSGKKLFNSFTHSGYHHVRRRTAPDGIGANYPEQELISAIQYVDAISIMCMIAFAGICGNDELAKASLEKAKEYSV